MSVRPEGDGVRRRAADIALLQQHIDSMMRVSRIGTPRSSTRAEALVAHWRAARIVHTDGAFRVSAVDPVTGETRASVLSGAKPQLERVFYPTLVRDDARGDGQRGTGHGGAAGVKRMCPMRGGVQHGSLVHAGVERFTQLLRAAPGDAAQRLLGRAPAATKKRKHGEAPTPQGSGAAASSGAAAEPPESMYIDPCVIRFINTFVKYGWMPVASEVMIWDEQLGIATAIDVVAIDVTRDQLVGIELKTGYEHSEYNGAEDTLDAAHPDAYFQRPLGFVPNTPAQRHMLQLALSDSILRAQYNIHLDRLVVLRACARERCVRVYNAPDWTRDADVMQRVRARLAQCRRSGAALAQRIGSSAAAGAPSV